MYSTCIFCNKPLGSNEAIEAFPIGQRLAFDAARGRLWVVCRSCERWNLSPLDERWEAVEQAEKLYRDARKRVSTDNIGLAKVADGTTLVRIGEPMRPEFAAWRYGDQFGRRRTKAVILAGGGVALIAGAAIGGAAAGASIGGFAWMIGQGINAAVKGSPNTVVAKIRSETGRMMHVRRRHLGESSIGRADDGSLALHLRYKNGSTELTGREAERVAAIVVPKVNRFGGTKMTVASAVEEIETLGGSEGFLDHLADLSRVTMRAWPADTRPRWRRGDRDFSKYGLFSLSTPHRLALEMALHEEAERRAMDGELEGLERAWRDAEEVAEIADNLLVPDSVDEQFKKLKGGD